jgi:transposase
MTVKATCLVGLDVHVRQTHAAVLDLRSGELSVRRLVGAPEEVVAFLERAPGPVVAVYEAGPTGFGLARVARAHGIDVRVAAPGSIPKGPGDRVKTDRRDAIRLVRLLGAGELRFAFVPSIEDEAFRDLIRCIEDARGDLMRARHRLSKFLLRRGHRYQEARAWSLKHERWLRALRFDDGCSHASFADYLAAVELLVGRRATLLEVLEQQIPECSHAPVIARLRCFRGIDTLSAAGLCAEVGSFQRFPRPTLISGFLGIVPSERTSDLKRRQGSITKAGPGHARRLLVEAAHHYSRPPRIGAVLARRQQGQDPRIIEIAWRAQRRLYQRWQHLRTERRKPAGVVAIAVARELAGFLWEATTLDA